MRDRNAPPWWCSTIALDTLGVLLAIGPWLFSGPSLIFRVAAVAFCVAWWLVTRRVTSSLEIPIVVVLLSAITRLLMFVLH